RAASLAQSGWSADNEGLLSKYCADYVAPSNADIHTSGPGLKAIRKEAADFDNADILDVIRNAPTPHALRGNDPKAEAKADCLATWGKLKQYNPKDLVWLIADWCTEIAGHQVPSGRPP